jgi:thiol-disulfide isomerase/thioredoxin
MRFAFTLAMVFCLPVWPQAPSQDNAAGAEELEQRELNTALAEAGNSNVDFMRALEQHLKKYPQAKDRQKIERALVGAAIEAKDDRRVALYGESVLKTYPRDVQILEKVAGAILALHDDRESAERAFNYARTLELQLNDMRSQPPPEGFSTFRWQSINDRRLANALRLQAHAQGIMGKTDEAVALAKRGWETNATAAGAREWGRWLVAQGKTMDAMARYADAFTIEDPDSTEEDRAHDRIKLAELYHKAHKSEKGLGDLILEAYDRTSARTAERTAKVREGDPNLQAKAVLDFTLTAVKGDALKMQSLKGKTVVMDFWATWCGPCRQQRPMYELVEKKFAQNPNVVFLSVNTDEDRAKVPDFMVAQKWTQQAYYDPGLAALLRVGQIPTTIVLDHEGQIYSRMAGFIPDRFVDMLTARIEETLHGE